MLLSLAACGSSSNGGPNPPVAPTVSATTPTGGAINVLAASTVSASFSEAMDPTSMTTTTFTLTSGAAMVPVAGTVSYSGSTAVFTHSAPLASDTTYTASITTGGKSMGGMALAVRHTWSFSTGGVVVPPVAPTIVSSIPLDGASNAMANGVVSATFSEAMDPATLTTSTFTLTSGTPAVAVAGTVIYASSTAVFWPAAQPREQRDLHRDDHHRGQERRRQSPWRRTTPGASPPATPWRPGSR